MVKYQVFKLIKKVVKQLLRIDTPGFFIGKGGEEVISFGSGQPDLPPPPEVYKILPHYKDFKYGAIQGLEKLREILAEQYHPARKENFVITNGASEALDLVLRILVQRVKKILLPRPYYYSYPFNAKFAGLDVEYYQLEAGKINLEKLKKALAPDKALLINSPSNPTGSVQEISVLKELEKYSADHGMYIISDEVYKDLIYERSNYLLQGPKVITINSFSKTYAMCGFRVGYLYCRELDIVQSAVDIKTHTSMNTNILGQEMALEAAKVNEQYYSEHVKIWESRRNKIFKGLSELGLSLWKPEGAFYVFPEIKNSNKVINDLYYKYKVIAYDGAWFGTPDRVRFSYALDEDKIAEGIDRLRIYLQKDYRP